MSRDEAIEATISDLQIDRPSYSELIQLLATAKIELAEAREINKRSARLRIELEGFLKPEDC